MLLPCARGDKATRGACETFDLFTFRNEVFRNFGIKLAILYELIQVAEAQLLAELPCARVSFQPEQERVDCLHRDRACDCTFARSSG